MAHESGPRARRWRWLRRALVAVVASIALVIVLALILVHNLDRPWIKRRVLALVHAKVGIDIDYQATRVRLLEGIEVDDFVLRSPVGLRDIAPELARVRRIEAAWSTALFTGKGRRVERVALSDAALTVVLDENGKTSFDTLMPPDAEPSPPKKKTTLSRQAGVLDALAPALPTVDVRAIALTLVRTVQGRVTERVALRGAGIHAELDGTRLRASMGTPSAPLDLAIAHEREGASVGDAQARFWLTADVSSSEATAAIDLEVPKQTFVRGLGATHILHAEASARFDPAAANTEVAVAKTFAADGIATAEAALALPDEGAPFVRHAKGDIDFVRLLGIVPPELVPVRAHLGRGQVHYLVDSLALDALPRLNAGAKVSLDADFADVTIPQGDGDIELGTGRLSAHVVPGADASLQAKASLALDGGKLAAARNGMAAKKLALEIDATQAKDGALTGSAELGFAALDMAPRVAARGGKIGLRFERLAVDPAAPLAAQGDVAVTADLASLDVRTPAARTTLDGLALRARTSLAGKAPYALEADARAARLRFADGGGHLLADLPVHLDAKIDGAVPDLDHPSSSQGTGHFVLDGADLHARLDATKAADALEFSLESNAPHLDAVRPFVPADLAQKIPWARMALAIRTHGRVERILSAAPSLEQHAEVHLERPSFERVAARSVALVVDAKGTALHPVLDGNVHFTGLTLDGANASDDRISFGGALDREATALKLRLSAEGRAQAKLSTAFAFDRTQRAVTYDVEGNLARMSSLAALAPLVPGLKGVDLSKLEVALTARGTLRGVLSDVSRDGVVRLEPTPRRTAGIDGTIDLHAKQIGWSGGTLAVASPDITVSAKLHTEGARRMVDGHVAIDELRVGSGPRDFRVNGVQDTFSASLEGDLLEPNIEVAHQMALRAVKQDIVPIYPVGHATLALAARRGKDGVIRVSKLDIANGAGGTTLSLRGAFDPTEHQQRLAVRGTLHQDLAKMSTAPGILSGRGTTDVSFRVASPNLSTYRTTADVKVDGVSVRVPRSGVVVEDFYGEIPITMAFRASERGVRMLREDQDNPYSSLRFADQHPLLRRGSFISIRNLTLPQVSISSLVGNFQIEQNIISLRQFEMGIRGGRVTGLCALDWNGPDSTFNMHVRADGVKSSHGEPFTGNGALEISAGEHSIEGRAEVLQIGKRHLLDLLQLQDPYHVDSSINRVRSALGYGYPDRLRVTFNHGFASVHVTFGGLAGLVSVGDIRGIPMGPLIDRFLAPFFPSRKDP